jgi:hypothetical protein
MNIKIHIERLVLDGLPVTAAQGAHVSAAVENELARLLAGIGLSHALRTGGAVPAIRADRVRVPNELQPARLGREIANAVYGRIAEPRPGRIKNAPRTNTRGKSS